MTALRLSCISSRNETRKRKGYFMKSALFRNKTASGRIQCDLCPHHCVVGEGGQGRCKARGVRDGELLALGYGLVSSINVDPMEKKPLYHFMPGSRIFSIGGWGCSLSCNFCQNWSISQGLNEEAQRCPPEQIVRSALSEHTVGIAYTYNEPLINIEFVHDCAAQARRSGLVNVLVTNGFIEPEPASYLLPLVDALNIDVKSMDDAFYRKQCGGRLDPVLRFAVQACNAGCHVEITNLVIPGLNDEQDAIGALSKWIGEDLARSTPLHLSAYRPEFKLNLPSTPVDVLERARERCLRDLDYVYIGNAFSSAGRDTHCPGCSAVLVSRRGFSAGISGLSGGACAQCGRKADIVSSRDRGE